MSHEHLRDRLHSGIDRWLAPLCVRLARAGIYPNHVTLLGAVVAASAAAFVIGERPIVAGVLWLLAGGLDLLDGAMARASNRATALGAFLDSTLDRVAEGVMLAAIAYHFASEGQAAMSALVVVALLGSVLVSYTRARAEVLGLVCKLGLFTRAERVIVIGVALLANWLEFAVGLLVIGTALTAGQRIHLVWQSCTDGRATRDRSSLGD